MKFSISKRWTCQIILIGIFLIISGCKKSASTDDGFSFLEDEQPQAEISDASEIVEIISYSPEVDPVVFLTNSEKTFGVGVNSDAGTVEYEFSLDDVSVQKSNVPFYSISAADLTPGTHTLLVEATNALGSDTHTFNLLRNNAPVVGLSSNTTASISCSVDTFSLSVAATDADGDALTFSYLLNGTESSPFLNGSATASTATVLFTPNCGFAGVNAVTVRATDARGEYSDYSMMVTVSNPNSASIDSYSPTTNPTVILSAGSVDFILSASGNPPLTFAWDITPGSTIAACNNLSTCAIGGGDFTPGAYVLKGAVTDSAATSDFHNFNIVINDRPAISSSSPSNGSTIGMNCASSKNFSINIADLNHSNPGQTFTINWYVDGNAHATLSASNDTASYPMTSIATFSPSCSPLLLGDHVISVVVSDGYESATTSWTVNTNYFSNTCNNLGAGEICTLAGLPGMGSGRLASDLLLGIYPNDIIPHPTGGWFISDTYYDVVWYYNSTGAAKNVLGVSVPAGIVQVVVGTGRYGLGTDGQNAKNFYLNDPRGMAYTSSGDLFITDYGNHRVAKITSTGLATYFSGGGSSNTDGVARTSHKCNYPTSIALDEANDRIFVSCYGNTTNNSDGAVKYFMLSVDEGHTLVRKGSGDTAGTTGITGSARSRRAYSIVKHPSRDIVFVGELESCRILAASYGDTESYYNGAVNLTANNVALLTLNSACGNTLNKAYSDTAGRTRPYSLAVKPNGTTIDGLFISNYNNHNITFLNTTNADITIGGQTVTAGYYNNVFGTGAANKARMQPGSTASNLYYPLGIYADNTTLYVADRNNYSIASLVHSTANGAVDNLIGNITVGGYDGESPATLTSLRLNNPAGMDYSLAENALYFSDTLNYRIRKMSLSTGEMITSIGKGTSGASNTNPEAAFDAYMRNVRDVFVNDTLGGIFYSDTETSTGGNRNCLARFFNQSGSTQFVLNTTIPNGRISTVAGNYLFGCNVWNIADEGSSATSINLYEPWGIVSSDDGQDLYISSNNGHCIQHISTSGNINTEIGLCGTAGDVQGAGSFARLNNVGDLAIDPDPTYRSYPNFFIVDRANTTNSSIKYMNNSGGNVTIAGITIGPGEVGKIISGLNYGSSVAAFGDQICYGQGVGATGHNYEHTVTCINRTSGLQTFRVGRAAANTVKGGIQHLEEDEGVNAGSAIISEPFGLAFDNDGNLYISLITSNVIKKVKCWW